MPSDAVENYKRTFLLENGKVVYKIILPNRITNNRKWNTRLFRFVIDKYISVIEIVNHTACGAMVAGINLPWPTVAMGEMYVLYFFGLHKIYEPVAANLLCDRME
jgi:hypothetical protein